jgi:hypothetical protein
LEISSESIELIELESLNSLNPILNITGKSINRLWLHGNSVVQLNVNTESLITLDIDEPYFM